MVGDAVGVGLRLGLGLWEAREDCWRAGDVEGSTEWRVREEVWEGRGGDWGGEERRVGRGEKEGAGKTDIGWDHHLRGEGKGGGGRGGVVGKLIERPVCPRGLAEARAADAMRLLRSRNSRLLLEWACVSCARRYHSCESRFTLGLLSQLPASPLPSLPPPSSGSPRRRRKKRSRSFKQASLPLEEKGSDSDEPSHLPPFPSLPPHVPSFAGREKRRRPNLLALPLLPWEVSVTPLLNFGGEVVGGRGARKRAGEEIP